MLILGGEGWPATESGVMTSESLAQAGIILLLGIAIIISNVLIIATLLTGPGPKEVMNYYLLSLAAADLIAGVIMVPLSVHPALVRTWMYGDVVCAITGYLEATLWAVSVYSFMWIAVDRYLAIRKPLRYETVQTRTRCQCWVVFTWLTSMMACCPPLLGYSNQPHFDSEAFVCHLDWTHMWAYSVTLLILVLGPTLATIVYTYVYIFSTMRKMRQCLHQQDKEHATALSENLANPNHVMSFVLVMAFWLSWSPYMGLRVYEYLSGYRLDVPFLHFSVFWLGILNSFWKSLIYVAMSPNFRLGLRLFCLSICCRSKGHRRDLLDD